jgi:hypothetical protein
MCPVTLGTLPALPASCSVIGMCAHIKFVIVPGTRQFAATLHYDLADGRLQKPQSCGYYVLGDVRSCFVCPTAGKSATALPLLLPMCLGSFVCLGVHRRITTGFAFGMLANCVLHGTSLPYVLTSEGEIQLVCFGGDGLKWTGSPADIQHCVFAWVSGHPCILYRGSGLPALLSIGLRQFLHC